MVLGQYMTILAGTGTLSTSSYPGYQDTAINGTLDHQGGQLGPALLQLHFWIIKGALITSKKSGIWVVGLFLGNFWHEITLYAIDIDKRRFRTPFLTL